MEGTQVDPMVPVAMIIGTSENLVVPFRPINSLYSVEYEHSFCVVLYCGMVSCSYVPLST